MDVRKKLQLQPRLRLLADLIPTGARLADVGTDHGYLPAWLLQEGRIPFAIASDIRPEPLAHARRTAAAYGVEHQMDLRLCAGLEGIAPHEVDAVVIAGMGGETMQTILEAAPWTQNGIRLYLQPMTKTEMLRSWLGDNGYCFTAERLAFDKGFLYPVFCVTGGEMERLTLESAYGGIALDGDPLYGRYLEQQMTKLRVRIEGLRRSGTDAALEEAAVWEQLCASLREKREELS